MLESDQIRYCRHSTPIGRQRGIAAVEFALLAVIFFTIIFLMLEIARAVYLFNTLEEVTRRAAADAANSPFDSESRAEVRKRALFRDADGNLALGFPVTPDHLRIDYLSLTKGVTGTLTRQPVSSMPSCAAANALNCLTDPYGSNCIRLVQVRVCQPGGGADCLHVPYKSIFPFIDLSTVSLPRATTIVPAQSLGAIPGALPCP